MTTDGLFGYAGVTDWPSRPLANLVVIDNTCGMTSPGDGRERELAGPQRGRIPADTLANRLMLARKLAGISIRDAADMCDLGRGAWTKWENGSRPLDLLEITGVIAEKLDVDLEWLRFGGPLLPARGVPTKRSGSVTATKPTLPVRPQHSHPKGRGDSPRSTSVSGSSRRAAPVW